MPGEVCQLCGLDDAMTESFVSPGLWEYRCDNRHGGDGPHVWRGERLRDVEKREKSGGEGVIAGYGLLDDLMHCVHGGEGWVEYGIVEDRYSRRNPVTFTEICKVYGHHHIGDVR